MKNYVYNLLTIELESASSLSLSIRKFFRLGSHSFLTVRGSVIFLPRTVGSKDSTDDYDDGADLSLESYSLASLINRIINATIIEIITNAI